MGMRFIRGRLRHTKRHIIIQYKKQVSIKNTEFINKMNKEIKLTPEMIEVVKKDVVKTFITFINSVSEEEQYNYLCNVGFVPLNNVGEDILVELYLRYLEK